MEPLRLAALLFNGWVPGLLLAPGYAFKMPDTMPELK